jgi:hypothetical protein
MLYFDQAGAGIAGRLIQGAGVILLGASIASCGGTPSGRAEPIQETSPSVTYRYAGHEGLIDATVKAEAYCREFNARPTTTSLDEGDGDVTFVCDRTRIDPDSGSPTSAMPSNPTVNYSYRDERTLIDATSEAQRHCAGLGADARKSTVTTGTDGTHTVAFECVRTE